MDGSQEQLYHPTRFRQCSGLAFTVRSSHYCSLSLQEICALKKIAIIVRNETLDKCTGKGCLNAYFERLDAFADYPEETRLVGFTQDSGDLEKKIAKLKELGVEVVHLSSCIRGKSANYEPLAERLAQDFEVVGYTHGSCQGRTREAICLPKQGCQLTDAACCSGLNPIRSRR
jgi:predicted metal-binding protein